MKLDDAAERIDAILAQEGLTGFVSAFDLQHPQVRIDLREHEPVIPAAVYKIAVAVAHAEAVTAGTMDPGERVAVPATHRTGGAGPADSATSPSSHGKTSRT